MSRPREGVVFPFPTLKPSSSFRMVVRIGPRPGSPRRVRCRLLAPSPRKRTRASEGPADRVERSSPALRSPAGPPTSERVTSQTGVPPPRTGQNEMKPGADFCHAGPPGVSAHICGCQGAGSALSRSPAGHGKTPRLRPAFHRAGVCWRGRTPGPTTASRQRPQDRYAVGRLSTPVLWSTPSRSLVSDLDLAGRLPRLGTKRRPTTYSRGRLRQE